MITPHQKNRLIVSALLCAVIFSALMIITLLVTIVNGAFGYVYVRPTLPVSQLYPGVESVEELTREQLLGALDTHLSSGLIRRLDSEKPLSERSDSELNTLVVERVIDLRVVKSFALLESLVNRSEIAAGLAGEGAHTTLSFRSWLRPEIFANPQSPVPERAGIRTAVFGSLWMMLLSLVISFPIGVATAVYLEEYARDNILNRIIRLNIYNLAGIPSIIYGILGLVLFVRILEPFTSGSLFGVNPGGTENGRTIISAGATLGLLVLPIIIINAQEAIRGTPQAIRDSSYGLGATRWQTVWFHVLPYSLERIITGAILAVSRAIGETAPLVVVGAATFITVDPTGIFSKFTVLPIQIFQWTQRPEEEFRHIAAAAIIVLLILLLTMNSLAIVLRNHYSKKRRLAA